MSTIIGAGVKRKEDFNLVIGEGRYTDDVQLKRMTYMGVFRSPHAHAKIIRVDVSDAWTHKGVLAILVGDDIRQFCNKPLPLVGPLDNNASKTRWALTGDEVRFVGEPIAAVVATSRDVVRDALDDIYVEFEILPAIVEIEDAIAEDAHLVHRDMENNVCIETSGEVGDTEKAFRESYGIVTTILQHPRVIPNPMEPRAAVASFERGSGVLNVWVTTQEPHSDRGDISDVLGIPENKVRVVAIDVGGGFGCKTTTYPETILAAVFSLQLNRPVKWVEERQEHFISTTQGRGHLLDVQAAFSKNGILTGMRLKYYCDLGAYCQRGSHHSARTISHSGSSGVYKVKNISWSTYGVYTNRTPVGAYRAYNKNQAIYITERVMDLIAMKLGIDPAEVRLRNFVRADEFPYKTPTGMEYDSGDYTAGLNLALEMADYSGLRLEQKHLRDQGILMGIGLAANVETSGFGPSGALSMRPGYESAAVRADPEGKITVLTGSSPHGQGLVTAFSQIASDQLGVPFEDIEVIYGDTAIVPRGVGTYGNRSLVVGGTAIVKACERVKQKACLIAAAMLKIDVDKIVLENGLFRSVDSSDVMLSWADVSREAFYPRTIPPELERGLEATAYWEPSHYTFPYNANVAVVTIDTETGDVKLIKYILVDDCGVVVNPMLIEGQIHGGIVQGIGQALLEEARWDDSGQLLTGTFMDYAMPIAAGLPKFDIGRITTISPTNPLGVKGGAETGTCGATCAIVNAVVDALSFLGVTHVDMPVTSEKLWAILKEKGYPITAG